MAVINFQERKQKQEVDNQFKDDPLEILELIMNLPINMGLLIINVDGNLRITKICERYLVDI